MIGGVTLKEVLVQAVDLEDMTLIEDKVVERQAEEKRLNYGQKWWA
jgi:hypothetical protein